MKLFLKLLLAISATMLLTELSIRLVSFFGILGNIYQGVHISPYDQSFNTWYFMEKANSRLEDTKSEFSYSYTINEFGCLDYPETDTTGLRILILGDSYSFGIGAHQDSSWAIQLKSILEAKTGRSVYLINASRQGSDPFFSYMVYRDKMALMKPDIILLGLNSSDLYEVYARGGYERFKADGSTATKKSPPLAWLYKYSHLGRYFMKKAMRINNAYLYKESQEDQLIIDTQEKIGNCLEDFKETAHQHNAQFIPFIFSLPWEITYGHKDKILTLSDRKALSQDIISIRDCMNDYYQTHDISAYYWPEDRHYNAKGYKVMAECLSNQLLLKLSE